MTTAMPCSQQWDDAELPAPGSASVARFWVALEQDGPWGRNAFAGSHLPDDIGPALEREVAAAGGRALLIRRPGRHADKHDQSRSRTVLLAGGLAQTPWLMQGRIDDPAALIGLDWATITASPDHAREALPGLESAPSAVLVCTNSKRDVCCAVRGRPVALAAGRERPGQVWECSHTGGHRFAPTAVALPSGQTYARLDGGQVVEAVDAEAVGRVPASLNSAAHNRGRSCLAPPAQAAEAAVRVATGDLAIDAFTVEGDDQRCIVTDRSGRTWSVRVQKQSGPELLDSCAKLPKASSFWTAEILPD